MDELETHPETVQVPTYRADTGLRGWHDRDESLSVRLSADGNVIVSANMAGLRGLARELLSLAQHGLPEGSEVFLTSQGQAPTLLPGSSSLLLIRKGN